MKMVYYRWPVEIVRAHFALQVLTSILLEAFFKILNRTVVISYLKFCLFEDTFESPRRNIDTRFTCDGHCTLSFSDASIAYGFLWSDQRTIHRLSGIAGFL